MEWLVAKRIDSELRLRGIKDTHYDFFAEERRAGADAKIDGSILRQLHLDASVLRDAAFGNIEARHNLQTSGQLLCQLHWGLRDFLQYAVHAQAYTIGLLEGLKVNIRRAPPDGIQHDLVDEANDRRILYVVAAYLVVALVFTAGDLERIEIHVRFVIEGRHLVVDLLERLIDRLLQLIVFNDDRFDSQTGLELDLINGVQIRRVGNREEQPLTAPKEGQHSVARQQLVRNQANRVKVQVYGVEIEQGHAKLVRRSDCDIACLGGAVRHQLGDDAALALACGIDGIQHGRLFDHPILDQPLRQAPEAPAIRAQR